MEQVSKEIAQKEVQSWLDYKKINDRKRENYQDNIDTLVEAIMDGTLVLKEDKSLIHTLKFPIENEVVTSQFEYKPRLKVSTVQMHLQGVKSTDVDGRILAYVAALASKPKEVIKALDTEDYSIAQAVSIFFL